MSKKSRSHRGFTLIELMVTVAIIGILASVTYASLSGARDRARNGSATASMQSILVEATLYRSRTGSYAGFCGNPSLSLRTQVQQATGVLPTCNVGGSGTTFGATVRLRGTTVQYYCVDSNKVSKVGVTGGLPGGVCPAT